MCVIKKKRLYHYIEIFLLLKTVSFFTSHSVHLENSKRLRRDIKEREEYEGHEMLEGHNNRDISDYINIFFIF